LPLLKFQPSYNLIQQVYGDAALLHSRVFEWHKRFNEGQETTEDDTRSSCPSSTHTPENTGRVQDLLKQNH